MRMYAPWDSEVEIAFADFVQSERDYKNMPAHIPTIKANLAVGHMATYGETHGGSLEKRLRSSSRGR